MADDIQKRRAEIDKLEDELAALLQRRAAAAQRIGALKGGAPAYRPEREAEVLRRISGHAGILPAERLAAVFREIISACRSLEEAIRVAYLGPEGTFSEQAVRKHFGRAVEALPFASVDEAFRRCEAGAAQFAVVPVENSTEGAVGRTLDLLVATPLKICGEIELRIHQHLMGRMQDLRDVKRVCSHPQSLAQCRGWLKQHLPDVEIVPVVSNAEAARRARDEEGTAALAGEAAAKLYNLRILFNTVEDRDDNTTRFVVVGRKLFPSSGKDKTSLLVSAAETEAPGVLLHLLAPLSKHGVNMTRIESRPSRQRKWDYVFFLDLDGHADEEHVRKALDAMKAQASLFKVLGSFPKAVL